MVATSIHASLIRSSPAVVRIVLVSDCIVNDGSEPTLRYRSTYPQNEGKSLRRGGLILWCFFPTKNRMILFHQSKTTNKMKQIFLYYKSFVNWFFVKGKL